ncbi:hypothetical protein D3C72_2209870 [compost metagenome]
MQLDFVRPQTAVALINIDIARKCRVIRIIATGMVGINRDGQAIGITLHQWAIIAWDAKLTL